MKKLWYKIPRRTRFWINIIVVGILLCTISFGYGTFYPNPWTKNKIVNETENTMVSEWNSFGFEKPSIEYNNNKWIDFYKKGLDYIIEDDQLKSAFYEEMSLSYKALGDNKMATEYYNRAMELKDE